MPVFDKLTDQPNPEVSPEVVPRPSAERLSPFSIFLYIIGSIHLLTTTIYAYIHGSKSWSVHFTPGLFGDPGTYRSVQDPSIAAMGWYIFLAGALTSLIWFTAGVIINHLAAIRRHLTPPS